MGLADADTETLDQANESSNAYLADALSIRSSDRVVDLGCGVGGTAIWLALRRRARVVGITLDEEQRDLAEGFARERGALEHLAFEVRDYAQSGLDPASFDVAIHLESLCHAHDTRQALAHAAELLKPGGRYGCLDCFPVDPDDERVRAAAAGWHLPGWTPLDSIGALVRDVGFSGVEVRDLTDRVTKTARQLRAMAQNAALLTRLERASGHDVDPHYEGHLLSAIAMADGLLGGVIRYGGIFARKA